jgi:hypothetical protein
VRCGGVGGGDDGGVRPLPWRRQRALNALLSAKEGEGEGERKFKGGTQDGEVRVRQGAGSIQVDHTSRLQLGEVLKCAQSAAASAQAAASIQSLNSKLIVHSTS